MRALLSFILLPVGILLWTSGEAIEIHHRDGTRTIGALIEETPTEVTILDAQGKKLTIALDDIVRVDKKVRAPRGIEERAARERAQRTEKRRREAWKLLQRTANAEGSERGELLATLDAYPEAIVLPAYSRGLVSKKKAVRQLSLERAPAFRTPDATIALAMGAVASPDPETAREAHARAYELHPELAVTFYEYVALYPTEPAHRIQAIGLLGDVGDWRSGRALIGVIEHVNVEGSYQRAQVINKRQKPLTLGNTQLTVELPMVEVISVEGNVTTTSLRTVANSAIGALQSISGYEYGNDLKAWRRWLKRQSDAAEREGSESPAIPPRKDRNLSPRRP